MNRTEMAERVHPVTLCLDGPHSEAQLSTLRAVILSGPSDRSVREIVYLLDNCLSFGQPSLYEQGLKKFEATISRSAALAEFCQMADRYFARLREYLGKNFEAELVNSLLNPVCQIARPGHKVRRLMVSVSNTNNNAMLSNPLLWALLRHTHTDILFTPGFPGQQSSLQWNIPGVGRNTNQIIEEIKNFRATEGYAEIVLLGTSSSAWFSFLAGQSLEADTTYICGMRPQQDTHEVDDTNTLSRFIIGTEIDLSTVRTPARVAAGDKMQGEVELLGALSKSHLIEAYTIHNSGHLCLRNMISNSQFYDFFDLN